MDETVQLVTILGLAVRLGMLYLRAKAARPLAAKNLLNQAGFVRNQRIVRV